MERQHGHTARSVTDTIRIGILVMLCIAAAACCCRAVSIYSNDDMGSFRHTGSGGFAPSDMVKLSTSVVAPCTDCRAVANFAATEVLVITATCVLRVDSVAFTSIPFAADCMTSGVVSVTTVGSGVTHRLTSAHALFQDAVRARWIVGSDANQLVAVFSDGSMLLLAGDVAGAGANSDGQGTAAKFNSVYPGSMLTSESYVVSDRANSVVKEVTSDGYVTTVGFDATAGCSDGTGTASALAEPIDARVASDGALWVVSAAQSVLMRRNGAGYFARVIGQCGTTTETTTVTFGTATVLNMPTSVVPTKDVVYVQTTAGLFRAVEYSNNVRCVPLGVSTTFAEGRVHAEGSGAVGAWAMHGHMPRGSHGDFLAVATTLGMVVEFVAGRMVAHYSFDGSGRDTSGSNNHIAVLGTGVAVTTDMRGAAGASSFDGTANAYAVVPNAALDTLSSYCICALVEVTSFPSTLLSVATAGAAPFIDFYTTSTDVHLVQGSSTFTQAYSHGLSNGWRHVCAWRDGAKIGTAIQGVRQFTGVNTPDGSTLAPLDHVRLAPTGVVVGQQQQATLGSYARSLTGKVSDVTLFNYAPTQAELQQMQREEYPDGEKMEVWSVRAIAGSGSAGLADGVGSAASFDKPVVKELTFRINFKMSASSGIGVLVADENNHCVRYADNDGTVSTAAGLCGTSGNNAGSPTAARFTLPRSLARGTVLSWALLWSPPIFYELTAPDGPISNVVARCSVASAGVSSTVVDGTCGVGTVSDIIDMVCFNSNDFWIVDRYSHRIRQVDPTLTTGSVTTKLGTGSAGCVDGTSAEFNEPISIGLQISYSSPNGVQYIYVVEAQNHRITRIVKSDTPLSATTIVGGCGTGSGVQVPYGGVGTNAFVGPTQAMYSGNPSFNGGIASPEFALVACWDASCLQRMNIYTKEVTMLVPAHRYPAVSTKSGRAFHGGAIPAQISSVALGGGLNILLGSLATHSVVELMKGITLGHFPLFSSLYQRNTNRFGSITAVGSGATLQRADQRGEESRALLFDGTANGYVDIDPGLMLDLATSYSVCMWLDIMDDAGVIFQIGPSATQQAVWLAGATSLMADCNGNQSPNVLHFAGRIAFSGWHHYCFAKNGGLFHIIIDGVVRTTGPCVNDHLVASTAIRFGEDLATGNPLKMAMADMFFFNYALLPAEIDELMERGERRHNPWSVRIVGGSGSSGTTNGIGTAASINFGFSALVTIDSGDPSKLVVPDSSGNCFRKFPVNSDATTTDFAGTCGTSGAASYTTAGATVLRNNHAIVWDPFNNRYAYTLVNDPTLIVAMDTAGTSSVLCGTSQSWGITGTTCTSTNVFSTDSPPVIYTATVMFLPNQAHIVRRIDSVSTVTTVLGDQYNNIVREGKGTEAGIRKPSQMIVDPQMNLWLVFGAPSSSVVGRVSAATVGTTYELKIIVGQPQGHSTMIATVFQQYDNLAFDSFGRRAAIRVPGYLAYNAADNTIVVSGRSIVTVDVTTLEVSTIMQSALQSGLYSPSEGRHGYGGFISGTERGNLGYPYPYYTSAYPSSVFIACSYWLMEIMKGELLAHYRLHGNGVDASHNLRHIITMGSGVGGGSGPTGRTGTAMTFDGTSNAFAVIPNEVFGRTFDFTVCMWVEFSVKTSTFFTVATPQSNSMIAFYSQTAGGSDATITIDYSAAATSVSAVLPMAGWNHYCVTRSGADLHLSRNGALVTSASSVPATTVCAGATGAVIGQRQGTPLGSFTNPLQGSISELVIYNYAMTTTEIGEVVYRPLPDMGIWSSLTLVGSPSFEVPSGSSDSTGTASMLGPTSVAPMGSDAYLVADPVAHCIKKVTMAGRVTTFTGRCMSAGMTMGTTPTTTLLYAPNVVYYDAASDRHVAAGAGYMVTLTASGVPALLCGSSSVPPATGNNDSPTGSAALFDGIGDFDMSGGAYILPDQNNNLIRRVAADGAVTTVAGSGVTGCTTGTGTVATIEGPLSVATDITETMWVTAASGLLRMTAAYDVTHPYGCGLSTNDDGWGTSLGTISGARAASYIRSHHVLFVSVPAAVTLRVVNVATGQVSTVSQAGGAEQKYLSREGRMDAGPSRWLQTAGCAGIFTAPVSIVCASDLGAVVEVVPGRTVARYAQRLPFYDMSGNGNHMRQNTVAVGAELFDGTTSTLAVLRNSVFQAMGTFSVCFNAQLAAGQTSGTMFSISAIGAARFVEIWYATGTLHFKYDTRVFSHVASLTAPKHFCFVKDGQHLLVHTSGKRVLSNPSVGRLPLGTRLTALGVVVGQAPRQIDSDYDPTLPWKGNIVDLLITNYATTEEESLELGGAQWETIPPFTLTGTDTLFSATESQESTVTSTFSTTLSTTAAQSLTPSFSASRSSTWTASVTLSASASLSRTGSQTLTATSGVTTTGSLSPNTWTTSNTPSPSVTGSTTQSASAPLTTTESASLSTTKEPTLTVTSTATTTRTASLTHTMSHATHSTSATNSLATSSSATISEGTYSTSASLTATATTTGSATASASVSDTLPPPPTATMSSSSTVSHSGTITLPLTTTMSTSIAASTSVSCSTTMSGTSLASASASASLTLSVPPTPTPRATDTSTTTHSASYERTMSHTLSPSRTIATTGTRQLTRTMSLPHTRTLHATATHVQSATHQVSPTISPMPYTPAPTTLSVMVGQLDSGVILESALNGKGNFTAEYRTLVFGVVNDEFNFDAGDHVRFNVVPSALRQETAGFATHIATIARGTKFHVNKTVVSIELGIAEAYAISSDEVVEVTFSPDAVRSRRLNAPNGGRVRIIAQVNQRAQAAQAVVTAAVGTSMAAAAANPGAGEVQTTVLLGLMTCSGAKERQATKEAEKLIAPWSLGEGRRGMLLGNGTLISIVLLLFAVALAMTFAIRRMSNKYYTIREAFTTVHFPALFVSVAQFLHQGTVFAGAALLTEEESSGLDRFLGFVGTAYAVLVVALISYWSRHLVNGTYAEYAALFHSILGRMPIAKYMLPEGCWGPDWFYSMYGSLIAPFRREGVKLAAMPLATTTVMAFCAGLNVGTSKAACGAKYIILCLEVIVVIGIILVFRPYRSLLMNLLMATSQCGLLAVIVTSTLTHLGHEVEGMHLNAIFAQSATATASALYMICVALAEAFSWRAKVWHSVLVVERTTYHQPLLFGDAASGEGAPEETAEEREGRIRTSVTSFLNYVETHSPLVRGQRNRKGMRSVTIEELV